DVLDGEEVRAIGIPHEYLLGRWRAARQPRQHASHAFLPIAAIRRDERGADTLGALQEAVAIEGLQQIIERLDLEGPDRMLRVGRREDDDGCRGTAERIEHLEAAACAELDIEIKHIRRQFPHGDDRRLDPIGLRHHLPIFELADEAPELRAGRRLIVNDDHRVVHPETGNSSVTTVPRGERGARLNSWSPGNMSSSRRATFESPVPWRSGVDGSPTPLSAMIYRSRCPLRRTCTDRLPRPSASPCRSAFSTSGCKSRRGTSTLSSADSISSSKFSCPRNRSAIIPA